MRLSVRIFPVEPGLYELPERCPHPNCDGQHFTKHQDHCAKAIRDPKHEAVEAQRYRCLRCRRTFRVYPQGVVRLSSW
jgi:transposase-like protein